MASSSASGTGTRKKASRRGWWRWVLAFGVLALAAAGLLYFRPWVPHPKPVAVMTVTPGPASRVLAVNGRIVAVNDLQLRSTVTGQVETVLVHEGDEVTRNQVLATLDASQQKAATDQAEAALSSARIQEKQAQANYDRAKGLAESISRKDLESAQVARQTASNDVDRLAAALAQARSLLDAYTIRSPIAGTVLSRGIDPGVIADPSSTLFEVADLDHLQVEATVDELYAADIHRGLDARLRPAGSNRVIDAQVGFISPTVDDTTGGRLVRVPLPEAQSDGLPIGLTVDTNIVVDRRDQAITVPRAAVVDPRTRPVVLLVKDGKAVRTPVEFIDWPAGDLIVTSGLSRGDVVITDPSDVTPGAAVAPKAR